MGHGQYLVYSSKSSIFEECIIVFQVLVYISKCYRFLKSALSFSKPQLNFQKITMFRILLSIALNFWYIIIHTSQMSFMWLNSVEEKTPSSTSSQSNRYTQIHKPPRGMVSGSRFMPWYHLSGGSIPYPKLSKRGMQISVYRVLWITKP